MIGLAIVGLIAIVGTTFAVWLRSPGDSMTMLGFALTVSFIYPQRFVIVGLDSAGAPSLLVGVLLFGFWVLGRLHPGTGNDKSRDLARIAFTAYAMFWLLSFAIGATNPGGVDTFEGIARSLLALFSFIGFGMFASDAIRNGEDLQRLLRILALLGGMCALIGLIQFVTRTDPLQAFNLPGLQVNPGLNDGRTRSNFVRAAGTAFHPIEFSVVLAMVLPVAIHTARTATTKASRRLLAASAVLCGAGALISVSRSGVLTLLVSLTVYFSRLGWADRRRYAALGFTVLVGVYMLVPGLLGTLRGLFANAGNDPSIINRQNDIPFVLDVVRSSPIFGVGQGQITVDDILLDNEFYGRVMSGGILGLIVFMLVLLTPLVAAYARSQIGEDQSMRSAGAAIAAGLSAAFVSFATFDGFFFRLFVMVLAILLAAGGAVWRLRREDPAAVAAAPIGSLNDASHRETNPFVARRRRRQARAPRAVEPASRAGAAQVPPRT